MMLKFKSEDHSYDSGDGTEWTSVTRFVSQFHEEFDAASVAYKVSENKKSKWYGIPPDEIVEIWNNEAKRSTVLGDWYHNDREENLLMFDTITRHNKELQIFKPLYDGNVKIAPDQKLVDGVYPELLVYLNSIKLCGQSDLVEVVNGEVHITDYKTNKEIKKEGFSYRGKTKKLFPPVDHLDDCNFNHYALQLSTYMYIILRHNPNLKFGSMTIHHISFEKEGEDKFGFPIHKKTEDGYCVEKIDIYDIPYLKKEVENMIKYSKKKNVITL